MSIWYVNPAAANDASAGTSWAAAKKNLSAVTPSAGDEIRLAKSSTTSLAGTLSWTDGSLTITTSSDLTGALAARQMISLTADGSDGWWEIASISSTTITLASPYAGTGGTATSYKLNPFDAGSITGGTTTVVSMANGGVAGSPVLVSGGWDTNTNTQTGQTHFWTSGSSRAGVFLLPSNVTVSKVHVHRFGYGFYCTGDAVSGVTLTSCGGHSCGNTSATLSGKAPTVNSFQATGGVVGVATDAASPLVNIMLAKSVSNYALSIASRYGRFVGVNTYRCGIAIYATAGSDNEVLGGNVGQSSQVVSSNGGRLRVSGLVIDGAAVGFTSAYGPLYVYDCKLTSIATVVGALGGGSVHFDRFDQVAGDHRRYDVNGNVQRNATAGKNGSSAAEMKPTFSADFLSPLEQTWQIPCRSGVARNTRLWLRKTADWNGSAVKVGLRRMGEWVIPPTSVVVATIEWKAVTNNVTCPADEAVELVVQADGTVGSVYVDDVSWS